MSIIFVCDNCGKRFKVDERAQGRRGRCSVCKHVMRIPGPAMNPASAPAPATEPAADLSFKLSPPEPHPTARHIAMPAGADHVTHGHSEPNPPAFAHAPTSTDADQLRGSEPHVPFDLLDDDDDYASPALASPEITRGLQEVADFEKNRKGYELEGERSGAFSLFGLRTGGPAGWITTKWRAGVGRVLRAFRWVDTWAYLISIPFLVLMILGMAVENRSFIHLGAVVIVLTNYGRFWADLLAFFVRPFKDGPLHGAGFLFPPYTVYYLVTHWGAMKKIVRRIATSCIPIVAVVLIYAFDSSVNPDAKSAQGISAKLKAGKHQLDREIADELSNVKRELEKHVNPKESGPADKP